MWKRMRQRLMGKGMCPCGRLHKKGGGKKKERKGEEISHSALPIVGVHADVKHVHDLQRIGEVITRLVVFGVEDPNRERTGILSSIAPVDWKDDIEPLRLSLTVTETFLEYPPEWWVIRISAIPCIRERWVWVNCIISGGGRGRTIPIG